MFPFPFSTFPQLSPASELREPVQVEKSPKTGSKLSQKVVDGRNQNLKIFSPITVSLSSPAPIGDLPVISQSNSPDLTAWEAPKTQVGASR